MNDRRGLTAATRRNAVATIALAKSRWFWAGAAFGLLSYGAMNYAVPPLTRVTRAASQSRPALANGVLAHIFLVGVPIAFVV